MQSNLSVGTTLLTLANLNGLACSLITQASNGCQTHGLAAQKGLPLYSAAKPVY